MRSTRNRNAPKKARRYNQSRDYEPLHYGYKRNTTVQSRVLWLVAMSRLYKSSARNDSRHHRLGASLWLETQYYG